MNHTHLMQKYTVKLTDNERETLLNFIKTGKAAAYKMTHARILLAADQDKADQVIAEEMHVSPKTAYNVRQRCLEEGIEAAINRKAHTRTRPPKITGDEESHLIALCCNTPPEGQSRWTLKLLANRMVALEIIDTISPTTIGRVLKKNALKPWKKKGVVHSASEQC